MSNPAKRSRNNNKFLSLVPHKDQSYNNNADF